MRKIVVHNHFPKQTAHDANQAYIVKVRRIATGADFTIRIFAASQEAAEARAKERFRQNLKMSVESYQRAQRMGNTVFRIVESKLDPDQTVHAYDEEEGKWSIITTPNGTRRVWIPSNQVAEQESRDKAERPDPDYNNLRKLAKENKKSGPGTPSDPQFAKANRPSGPGSKADPQYQRDKAYQETQGEEAAHGGKEQSSNPYPAKSEPARKWLEGFNRVKQAANDSRRSKRSA